MSRYKGFLQSVLEGMWNIACRDRLQILNLEFLDERRIKNGICVYKMFNNLLQLNVDDFFEKFTFTTRGHVYKIRLFFRRLSLTYNFFKYCCILRWNALPSEFCDARNVRVFKQLQTTYDFTSSCKGSAFK